MWCADEDGASATMVVFIRSAWEQFVGIARSRIGNWPVRETVSGPLMWWRRFRPEHSFQLLILNCAPLPLSTGDHMPAGERVRRAWRLSRLSLSSSQSNCSISRESSSR